MVNHKKVKGKIVGLITEGPWYSNEYDVKAYNVKQYARKNPNSFQQDLNAVITALDKLDKNSGLYVNGKKK